MQRQDNEQFIMETYLKKARRRFSRIAGQFCEDPTTVLNSAESIFNDMLPDMAYINNPDHPMATSVFSGCAIFQCICL